MRRGRQFGKEWCTHNQFGEGVGKFLECGMCNVFRECYLIKESLILTEEEEEAIDTILQTISLSDWHVLACNHQNIPAKSEMIIIILKIIKIGS